MRLYDLLTKLKWKKENVTIEFVHREGKSILTRSVELKDVRYVGKGHFEYGERETYIPFHRVVRVIKDGRVIWKRSTN